MSTPKPPIPENPTQPARRKTAEEISAGIDAALDNATGADWQRARDAADEDQRRIHRQFLRNAP